VHPGSPLRRFSAPWKTERQCQGELRVLRWERKAEGDELLSVAGLAARPAAGETAENGTKGPIRHPRRALTDTSDTFFKLYAHGEQGEGDQIYNRSLKNVSQVSDPVLDRWTAQPRADDPFAARQGRTKGKPHSCLRKNSLDGDCDEEGGCGLP
jgi:hypothetical protein